LNLNPQEPTEAAFVRRTDGGDPPTGAPARGPLPRFVIASVLILTLLAAAVRLYDIGGQGLHFDESYTLLMANGRPAGELGPPSSYNSNPVNVWMLDTRASRDLLARPVSFRPATVIRNTYHYEPNHPPLYYMTVNLSLALFGPSEIAMRLPSVLFGTLVVPFVFLLGYRLKDAEVGLIAAGLFAFASLQVYFSQWARMYSLFILMAVVSTWILIGLSQRRQEGRPEGWPMWCAYIFVTTAGLYSYYLMTEMLAVQGLYVLLTYRRDRAFLARWFGAMGLCALFYLPWMAALAVRKIEVPTMIEWAGPGSPAMTSILTILSGVRDFAWVSEVHPYKFIWVLSALFLLGIGSALRTRSLWLIVAWLALPPAVVIGVVLTRGGLNFAANRYYLLASPALYLLIALGIVSLRPRLLSRVVAVAVLGYMMVGGYWTAEAKLRKRIQFKEAAGYISQMAHPDDLVMLIAPTSNRIWGMNLAYYLNGPEKIVLARGTTPSKLDEAFSFTKPELFRRLIVATAVPYQGGEPFDPKEVAVRSGFLELTGQKEFHEIAVLEYRRMGYGPESRAAVVVGANR